MTCPRSDDILLYGWDRLHGLSGRFPIVQCRTCGLVRTTPRPTLKTIAAYYPDHYGPYHANESAFAVDRTRSLTHRLRRWLRWDGTRDLVPAALKPGRVLELGCAAGDFLQKLRARGWDATGIEPSSTAASRARARGFVVHTGTIESAPDFGRTYDLVVASHVVEHLHEPVASLRRLRDWVRPGGWLACSMPDSAAFLFRTFGNAWYDLDVPRHLFHFQPRTFAAVLERAGWRLAKVRPQSTLNSLMGSLGHALSERARSRTRRLGQACARYPESRAIGKKLLAPPLEAIFAMARQTGRMVVWARAS